MTANVSPPAGAAGRSDAGRSPAAAHVDLHLHSTASDGKVPPAQVVREVASRGLSGLSLTDHDTVDGLEEAAAEARRLGVAWLPGAELSANEPGRSVHLLAYGFDPADRPLRAFLASYREDRIRRAREIAERLAALGVSLPYAEVEAETGAAAPTRAHIARALVRTGAARSEQEVFRRWLSRGKPAFVEKRPTPPTEVIGRVHAAGGVVLLAHPGSVHRPAAVRRWVAQGLDGVEVRHPENTPAVRRSMEALCAELDLLRSGGSDWHGPDTRRGDVGSEVVPAEWMEAIAARSGAAV